MTEAAIEAPKAEVVVTSQSLRDKLGATSPDALVPYINLLAYGDPGAGKTFLGGTADDDGETSPLLVLDVEGGLMTIRARTTVDVMPVRSIKDIEDIYGKLHSGINTETNSLYYKTIFIDSLTELQKLDMRMIMKEAPGVLAGKQDPDMPSQREWGISQEHIRKIVRAFRDLPCNTIFSAHVSTVMDNRNRMTYGPDLPGKLRNQVSGFLDVVGYLYATSQDEQVVRKIQFAKTDTVIAKDRTGALGDVVVNPTIPMLWDLIHSEGTVSQIDL